MITPMKTTRWISISSQCYKKNYSLSNASIIRISLPVYRFGEALATTRLFCECAKTASSCRKVQKAVLWFRWIFLVLTRNHREKECVLGVQHYWDSFLLHCLSFFYDHNNSYVFYFYVNTNVCTKRSTICCTLIGCWLD